MEVRLALFISGAGSTAQHLVRSFAHHTSIQTPLIVSNNLHFRWQHQALKEVFYIDSKADVYTSVREILQKHRITHIILAGFLKKIPLELVQAYPNKIVNIHPALLPKFGGKGMYGLRVHQAVLVAKELESGCTIHLVNEHYDEGAILAQYSLNVTPADTPEELQERVKKLEKEYYPKVIEKWVLE